MKSGMLSGAKHPPSARCLAPCCGAVSRADTQRHHPRGSRARPRRSTGQILILFAFMLPVLATGAVLTIDAGFWMVQKRQVQYAVDAAAMVGAQGINEETAAKNQTAVVNKAREWLANNLDFPAGVTTCVEDVADPTPAQFCAVNHAPQNGIYAGNFRFVEVIVRAPAISAFYNMFHGLGFGTYASEPVLYARAVTGGVQPLTYALVNSGSNTASACGQNPVCFGGGGGGGTINGNICSNGGVGVSGSNTTVDGTVVAGGTIQSGLQGTTGTVSTAAGNLDTSPACPTPSCDVDTSYWTGLVSLGDVTVSTTLALVPGRYSSLTIDTAQASNQVTLTPGVYYIDGDFSMRRGTIPAVSGVTFIVGGDFEVTNNSTIGSGATQSMASTGSAVGAPSIPCNMLIYLLPGSNEVDFKSNDPVWLSGTIYAPGDNSEVNVGGAGGGSLNLQGQIFSRKTHIQGTGTTITYDYGNTAYIPNPYLAE